MIQTGLHSHKNGFRQNGDKFNADQVTFPKLLQKSGYETAIIGKWHLGTTPQGFDYWDLLTGQGHYYNPTFWSVDGKTDVEGYCTDIVTDKALRWLKERDSDKPFMLMCQHKAPHRTWMPAIRHLDLYADKDLPEPETLFDRWEDNASGAKVQEMEIDRHMHMFYDLHLPSPKNFDPSKVKGYSLDKFAFNIRKRFTEAQRTQWDAKWKDRNEAFAAAELTGKDLVRWKYQRYVKNYLRSIKGVDESVGQLVAWLEENGLRDNTIVIYSSDQGFYLGEHGWYDKRWMYDESMKMPLIVSWPGVTTPGSVCHELVQNIDYAETFLEVAEAEIPEAMQGKSLVPLLRGEVPEDWRQSVYYHYYENPGPHNVPRHFGVRTKDLKLIDFYQLGESEFYDLNSDPDERTNLYGKAEYSEQIEMMKSELLRLQEVYGVEERAAP